MKTRDRFAKFSRKVALAIGTPYAFAIALGAIVTWAALGALFQFSNSWQLVINTGTTIITFLVVFIIQATQNRDAKAIHLKLDELIHAIGKARDRLIDIEDMTEAELDQLADEFAKLRKQQGSQPTHRVVRVGARE